MTRLRARVTPNAGVDRIEISEQGALDFGDDAAPGAGWPELRIRVTAAPDKGKANAAVVKLLARAFGVSKSAVKIAGGAKSRIKTIDLALDEAAAARVIERLRKES